MNGWSCPACGAFVMGGSGHACGFQNTSLTRVFATTIKQVPVRCPVCEGHGRYTPSSPLPVPDPSIVCPKCNGERVLWASETRTEYLPA